MKYEKINPTFLSLILPFGMYFIYKTFSEISTFGFYFYLSFFYYFLLMAIFQLTLKTVEKIHSINQNKTKYLLIFEVVKFVLLMGFLFSSYFWIIFDYNNENFINVKNGNMFETFFDFYFYSLTSFIMNNGSDIKPTSILSKIIVLTQNLWSFITIVIFLSQHKEIGNFFKEIEDRINGK